MSSVLWGTTGTAATFFSDDVSPIAVGATTMAVGGALLFVTNRRAALGMVAYPLAFYVSMDLAGVAIGNVVSLGSGPLFAALLEWRVNRQPLTRRWMLSTSIAIAGVALLVAGGHGSGSPVDPTGIPLGVALGLVAGAGYALFTFASGTVTVITLLEPLVATLLAISVVGERLDPLGWIGLAFIMVGVAVLSSARQPHAAA